MTYAEIVGMFGGEDRDPSETLLRLSVSFPRFGPAELLDVFRMIADEFRGKNDVNPGFSARVGGVVSAAAIFASAQRAFADKTYFSSDIIFRNVYRIMFQTSEWDAEILLQPDFVGDFCEFVSEQEPRRENHGPGDAKFNKSLDLYEILMEFKDNLVAKIKLASGV